MKLLHLAKELNLSWFEIVNIYNKFTIYKISVNDREIKCSKKMIELIKNYELE